MTDASLSMHEWIEKGMNATKASAIVETLVMPLDARMQDADVKMALGSFTAALVRNAIEDLLHALSIDQESADKALPKKLITPGRRDVSEEDSRVFVLLPNAGDRLEYLIATDVETNIHLERTKILKMYQLLLESKHITEPDAAADVSVCTRLAGARYYAGAASRLSAIPSLKKNDLFQARSNREVLTSAFVEYASTLDAEDPFIHPDSPGHRPQP